jgi:hypothetical protein
MAKIASYDDVKPAGARANFRVVVAEPDTMRGKQLEAGGEALMELSGRIREQQIDAEILRANSEAQAEIDRQMIELRKRDDWDQFGESASVMARETMERFKPKMGGLNAMSRWGAETVKVAESARQRGVTLGLQRGAEIQNGEIILARGDFARAAADPNTPAAELDRLRGRALAVAQLGRERGFLGEDDVANIKNEILAQDAKREAEIGKEQRILNAVDAARSKAPDDLDGQLELIRQLPADLREDATTRIMEEAGRDERARKARFDGIRDAAFQELATGERMSPEMRAEYEKPEYAEVKLQIESARRTRAMIHRQEVAQATEEAFRDVFNTQYLNPQQFVTPGWLESQREKFTDEQYTKLLDMREKRVNDMETAITQPPPRIAVLNNMTSTAERLAPSRLGPRVSLANNSTGGDNRARFAGFVGYELDKFIETQQRLPNLAEQRAIVERGMAATTLRGGDARPLYRLSEEARRANTDFNYIPQHHRVRIRASLIAGGVDAPTKAQVVAQYNQELAEARAQRGGN